jgi:hypothetical protein
MSKYVLVKMFKVTDSPFMEEREGASEAWELFQLNDEGQWVQECMPPLVDNDEAKNTEYDEQAHMELTAIKGFEDGEGEKLLRFLNKETVTQQMENGVSESDVVQGTTIINSLGHVLF